MSKHFIDLLELSRAALEVGLRPNVLHKFQALPVRDHRTGKAVPASITRVGKRLLLRHLPSPSGVAIHMQWLVGKSLLAVTIAGIHLRANQNNGDTWSVVVEFRYPLVVHVGITVGGCQRETQQEHVHVRVAQRADAVIPTRKISEGQTTE